MWTGWIWEQDVKIWWLGAVADAIVVPGDWTRYLKEVAWEKNNIS